MTKRYRNALEIRHLLQVLTFCVEYAGLSASCMHLLTIEVEENVSVVLSYGHRLDGLYCLCYKITKNYIPCCGVNFMYFYICSRFKFIKDFGKATHAFYSQGWWMRLQERKARRETLLSEREQRLLLTIQPHLEKVRSEGTEEHVIERKRRARVAR